MILGKNISLDDLESVDVELFNSLKWTLDNDIDGIIFNTFTVDEDHFGEMKTVDLKPGGAEIDVTDENKKEWVKCVVYYLSP